MRLSLVLLCLVIGISAQSSDLKTDLEKIGKEFEKAIKNFFEELTKGRPGNRTGGGDRPGNRTGGDKPGVRIDGGDRPGNRTGGDRPGSKKPEEAGRMITARPIPGLKTNKPGSNSSVPHATRKPRAANFAAFPDNHSKFAHFGNHSGFHGRFHNKTAPTGFFQGLYEKFFGKANRTRVARSAEEDSEESGAGAPDDVDSSEEETTRPAPSTRRLKPTKARDVRATKQPTKARETKRPNKKATHAPNKGGKKAQRITRRPSGHGTGRPSGTRGASQTRRPSVTRGQSGSRGGSVTRRPSGTRGQSGTRRPSGTHGPHRHGSSRRPTTQRPVDSEESEESLEAW